MERFELIDLIKEFLPNKAVDITESLEILKLVFNETNKSIGKRLQELFASKRLDVIAKLITVSEELDKYEDEIKNLIDLFDIDQLDDSSDEENSLTNNDSRSPNYDEYYVDRLTEHTLDEDFTYTKPYGFKLNHDKIVKVKSWKDLLVKTCEYLILINEEKFLSFENMKSMNGKKQKYFSVDASDLISARNVLDKIYIETNHNANTICNRVVALLEQYEFKVSNFKVYLNKDYSPFYKESKSE